MLKKEFLDKCFLGILISANISSLGQISLDYYDKQVYKSKLKKVVERLADINEDNFTSDFELSKAYTRVRPGLHYNAKNPPSDLTVNEMERYIEIRRKELIKVNYKPKTRI